MKRILTAERKSSENRYLHKDFHGALCYAVKYLDENYGLEATDEYFRQVAKVCFASLSESLKRDGLPAVERHFRRVFTEEEGKFSFEYEGDTLILRVFSCPAVEHLKKTGQFHTDRFCRSTVVVNDAVCRPAGYESGCDYEPGAGRCVQRFRRARGK